MSSLLLPLLLLPLLLLLLPSKVSATETLSDVVASPSRA
jgi:hypothetical protein